MTNKNLGTIALIGAPTMFIGAYLESRYTQLSGTWFGFLWCFLYISAWMCSMIAVRHTGVLGSSWLGRVAPNVLLITLTIANISNFFLLVPPAGRPSFYFYLDLFWPLSHTLMIGVGILAIRAKKLIGWKRYAPLAMGTWLPLALASLALLGRTPLAFFSGGLYNAIVVAALALAVRSLPDSKNEAKVLKTDFRPVLR